MKRARLASTLLFIFAFLGAFQISAYAADPVPAANTGCSYSDFENAMARSESGGNPSMSNCTRGNNGVNHCGKYQFSETLVARYGLNSSSSEADQDAAYRRYLADNWTALQRSGAASYSGQTDRYGTPITQSGLIAMSHLGGIGGATKYLKSGGTYNPGDGCGSSSDFCKGLRDSGMGVSQRNAAAKAQGLSCPNRHSYCGTYLSDYLAKFSKYGEGNTGCGDGIPTASEASKLCAPMVQAQIEALVKAAGAQRTDIFANIHRPPMSVAQTMKIPCKSNELQRIASTFSYAPSNMGSSVLGQLSGAAGPVSGLLNSMFKSDVNSFTNMMKAAGGISLDLGNFVQGQLSGLLGSLGLGDSPFASALCGLMADTLLKYIQCEAPITMPSLGNLTGSLNKLLPKGCAGDALRGALYSAASEKAFQPSGQSITAGQGGLFSGRPLSLGAMPTNGQR